MKKKVKWKTYAAIVTTVLSSIYGINIYVGTEKDDVPTIYEPIPTVTNNNQIVILFGKTYNLEDGQQIQITIDKFNRKRVIFTPKGERNVR